MWESADVESVKRSQECHRQLHILDIQFISHSNRNSCGTEERETHKDDGDKREDHNNCSLTRCNIHVASGDIALFNEFALFCAGQGSVDVGLFLLEVEEVVDLFCRRVSYS